MKTPLMTELTYDNRDTWTLKLTGSVDLTNHGVLWSIDMSGLLFDQVKATPIEKLVVDLTATERLDSQGLRHLYDIQKQFSLHDVRVVLKNPNTQLQRLFRIMQVNRIFAIEFDDDREIVV